jgi:hypothetical protein
MAIQFHPHAKERMEERGTTEEEAEITIEQGEKIPAKFGRTGFQCNFPFNSQWRGKYYATKQLEVYAIQKGNDWLVITVITKYF